MTHSPPFAPGGSAGCSGPVVPSPCDGMSTVEGSFFNPFEVLIPVSITLSIIKLGSRLEDFVDSFDNIWGQECTGQRSVSILLEVNQFSISRVREIERMSLQW